MLKFKLIMKKEIHPKSEVINIKCSTCLTEHELLTTNLNATIDVCSGCHAFYTGDKTKSKATGRIERFNRRFSTKK
ncbi:MAG: 50S ribosomal protein L31 [Metamycoplasmataceae bacterium]